MSATVEELTVEYEEDGVVVIKELDKAVLSKGAWATVIFRYQQWEKAKEAYSQDKFVIRRYQKTGGEYHSKSKFNISSVDQAEKIVTILSGWLAKD